MSKRPSLRAARSLDFLAQHYGPTVTISELSSITTQSEKTITNGLHKCVYPIPSFKIGGKRVFRLVDVADYLDQQFAAANQPKKTNRPGRPSKVELLTRKDVAAARRNG